MAGAAERHAGALGGGDGGAVVVLFLGVSPASSTAPRLLASLCAQHTCSQQCTSRSALLQASSYVLCFLVRVLSLVHAR